MIAIDRDIVETDVLVVGGGIAGLMGAIRAAELGDHCLFALIKNIEAVGNCDD